MTTSDRETRRYDRELERVAVTQAQDGDIAGALETSRGIGEDRRDWTLVDIAATQADAGDFAGALETTAREIASAILRDLALGAIAGAQAKAGDIAGALETARGIISAFWREGALQNIAQAQTEGRISP